MPKKPETAPDLAAELAELPPSRAGSLPRVVQLFGDQPQVLRAIEEAYARGVGVGAISDHLQARTGQTCAADSVRAYLKSRGLYKNHRAHGVERVR